MTHWRYIVFEMLLTCLDGSVYCVDEEGCQDSDYAERNLQYTHPTR